MPNHIILLEKEYECIDRTPDRFILSPQAYIRGDYERPKQKNKPYRVINLCRDYSYLSYGYYSSLLAEARGDKVIPGINTLVELNWKRIYGQVLPEVNARLAKHLKAPNDSCVSATYLIFFGRTQNADLEEIGRYIFDKFRCPIIALELSYKYTWTVQSIQPWCVSDLSREQLIFFNTALNQHTGTAWRTPKVKRPEKYWLAMLHNPKEKLPPSDKEALAKFIKAGKEQSVAVELITAQDVSSLLEYDALFIRETTAVNHHTYRFAKKAESEGMPVMDDPQSILRCSNKVYMNELFSKHHVASPRTILLDYKNLTSKWEWDGGYPMVLKIPDGSFSRGIVKVDTPERFRPEAERLFKTTDVILAQEFVPSEHDWRIGVLNGEALYACQYFMVKNHWQIVNHKKSGKVDYGKVGTIPIKDAPKEVVDLAVKASKLVGNGLYGVDIKQKPSGEAVVIEVNDNPNIDHGMEDKCLGAELYARIIGEFVRRLES